MKRLFFFALSLSLVLSCGRQEGEKADAEKEDKVFCLAKTLDDDMGLCKDGQTLAFFPQSWGSEQYPLYAALIYCDLDKAVVLTSGGVLCKFDKKKWQRLVELSKKNQVK